MRAVPELLPRGPLTVSDALAAGLSERVLRGRRFRRVLRGVYLRADVELTEDLTARAALLVLPAGTVVTSVTALRMRGVAVGRARPLRLASLHPTTIVRTGMTVQRVDRLPPRHGSVVTAEHAFASAAQHLNLLELVTAGDWLIRLKACTAASLTTYAEGYRGWGGRLARRAAALVRARVDSPPETRLRLCLVLAGLPEPVPNDPILWHDVVLGRPDLMYRGYLVCLEYEGDQHRSDTRQWNIDIGRTTSSGPTAGR